MFKLRYETGIATFIQFVSLSLLNIATGLDSIITTCRASSSDCVSNMLVSIIFFILACIWFFAVWVVGYMAQERRSKRLAQLLICGELLIALVALFNARHHTDILTLGVSILDLVLAVWIIILAFRLMRAGGGRVTRNARTRKRRPPTIDQ